MGGVRKKENGSWERGRGEKEERKEGGEKERGKNKGGGAGPPHLGHSRRTRTRTRTLQAVGGAAGKLAFRWVIWRRPGRSAQPALFFQNPCSGSSELCVCLSSCWGVGSGSYWIMSNWAAISRRLVGQALQGALQVHVGKGCGADGSFLPGRAGAVISGAAGTGRNHEKQGETSGL